MAGLGYGMPPGARENARMAQQVNRQIAAAEEHQRRTEEHAAQLEVIAQSLDLQRIAETLGLSHEDVINIPETEEEIDEFFEDGATFRSSLQKLKNYFDEEMANMNERLDSHSYYHDSEAA